MSVLQWIIANIQLFSGITVVAGGIIGLAKWGFSRWRERSPKDLTRSSQMDGRKSVPASRPLTSKLPGFVLRALYKPEAIESRVKLGLRSDAPASVYLSAGQIPYVELYFEVTNLAPIDLVLDRMLVEVWFGQPTFSTAFLQRRVIPAGEITEGLTVRQTLSEYQKAQIEAFQASGGNAGAVHIYVTAYFESKLGRLNVQRSIERVRL